MSTSSRSLTDYLRYELAGHRYNVEAGEDIRILPLRPGRRPDFSHRDYWLFDSSDLWRMDYDEEGRFLAAIHMTDAEETIMYGYYRDAALHAAIPYADYIRRL